MIRDIDIGALRTFLAVAEYGNMTHAATMRHLTQSAVSQQIKKLETMLATKLMRRSTAGVELTKAGHQLLPHARAMVRRNDETYAALTYTPADSDVLLGVPSDVVSSLLPSALAKFHRDYPHIHVTLISKSSEELRHMLELGQVDLALTTERKPDPEARLLFREPLIWIGAISGRAYQIRPLPVAVGDPNCPFRKAATEALGGTRWRAVTQVGSLEPVFATLLADMAVAPFLPGTLPHGTEEISGVLPELPEFCLQMRMKADLRCKPAEILGDVIAASVCLE